MSIYIFMMTKSSVYTSIYYIHIHTVNVSHHLDIRYCMRLLATGLKQADAHNNVYLSHLLWSNYSHYYKIFPICHIFFVVGTTCIILLISMLFGKLWVYSTVQETGNPLFTFISPRLLYRYWMINAVTDGWSTVRVSKPVSAVVGKYTRVYDIFI